MRDQVFMFNGNFIMCRAAELSESERDITRLDKPKGAGVRGQFMFGEIPIMLPWAIFIKPAKCFPKSQKNISIIAVLQFLEAFSEKEDWQAK